MIDNYGMFRIGSDGSWLGFQVEGQNVRMLDQPDTGGPVEGAKASIRKNNTVNISGDGYSLTGRFEDYQRDAAKQFVDMFNNYATPSE